MYRWADNTLEPLLKDHPPLKRDQPSRNTSGTPLLLFYLYIAM